MVLPGSSIGRYLVKRKLAEGGMAELYLCTAVGPEGFEKEVVIKRIRAFLSNDQGFIDMFKAEARLASRLNHANVVQIFDFDKHDDAWFIAMEYVYGASLWELRRRCRELAVPFPPLLVAAIGAQVARGLHYAHTLSDKGKPLTLVHRDVTPHNVLLSFDGGVKLTDFGIAKAGTSYTAPGMLKGKFAYMAPEQARGDRVDARTDVFALGITLWEMLTGGRLFEGDSDVAVLRAVQESLIASPARLNPDVPAELSDVVLKALERPLDQRFQSAHELDRALAHFVLKNSASTDDSNVGLFLRQMFRDELEEADRAMSVEHSNSLDVSQTPIVDGYALGTTRQVDRHHEPPTVQTATPVPRASPESDKPKTAQMPGLRSSRKLSPLMDDDDLTSKRPTDQMHEFASGAPREQTAQMPGLRSSRRLPQVVAASPEVNVETDPQSLRIAPAHSGDLEDSLSDPYPELPRRSWVPWAVAACLVVGLAAGLGFAVRQAKLTAPVAPTVVELPIAAAVVDPPPPSPPVDLKSAPEPVPTGVPESPAEPSKAEGPPAADPRLAVEPSRPKGYLQVEAIPFGTLYINNRKFADIEGAKKISLSPGLYTLRFEHPKQVKNESVTIKPGQTASVKFHPLQQ